MAALLHQNKHQHHMASSHPPMFGEVNHLQQYVAGIVVTLTWFIISFYHPAIKHGNGKSPMNGGFNGKIIYKWIVHSHLWLPEGICAYCVVRCTAWVRQQLGKTMHNIIMRVGKSIEYPRCSLGNKSPNDFTKCGKPNIIIILIVGGFKRLFLEKVGIIYWFYWWVYHLSGCFFPTWTKITSLPERTGLKWPPSNKGTTGTMTKVAPWRVFDIFKPAQKTSLITQMCFFLSGIFMDIRFPPTLG